MKKDLNEKKKEQSKYVNTKMLGLSDKHFKVAMIKCLNKQLQRHLKQWKQNRELQQRNFIKPNKKIKTENYSNWNKSSKERVNCRTEGTESKNWKTEQKLSKLNSKEETDFEYINTVSETFGSIAKVLIVMLSESYKARRKKVGLKKCSKK